MTMFEIFFVFAFYGSFAILPFILDRICIFFFAANITDANIVRLIPIADIG